jgi:hypothetical protein
MERALALGLIEVDERGDLRAPSPMIIEAGTELQRLGISADVILDLVAAIREDVDDIARRFLELVSDHLVGPMLEGREGAVSSSELVGSLQRLRPIALEVVRPFLAQALAAEIDRTVRAHGDLLDPTATPPPPDRSGGCGHGARTPPQRPSVRSRGARRAISRAIRSSVTGGR